MVATLILDFSEILVCVAEGVQLISGLRMDVSGENILERFDGLVDAASSEIDHFELVALVEEIGVGGEMLGIDFEFSEYEIGRFEVAVDDSVIEEELKNVEGPGGEIKNFIESELSLRFFELLIILIKITVSILKDDEFIVLVITDKWNEELFVERFAEILEK